MLLDEKVDKLCFHFLKIVSNGKFFVLKKFNHLCISHVSVENFDEWRHFECLVAKKCTFSYFLWQQRIDVSFLFHYMAKQNHKFHPTKVIKLLRSVSTTITNFGYSHKNQTKVKIIKIFFKHRLSILLYSLLTIRLFELFNCPIYWWYLKY